MYVVLNVMGLFSIAITTTPVDELQYPNLAIQQQLNQKRKRNMGQFLVNKCIFTLDGLAETILPRILHLSASFISLFNRRFDPNGKLINIVELTILEPLFIDHMRRLYVYFDTSTAINCAELHNSDFAWTDAHFTRDLEVFYSMDQSIPNVISYYKEKYGADRFNEEKVNRLFKDDEDYNLLLSIAKERRSHNRCGSQLHIQLIW